MKIRAAEQKDAERIVDILRASRERFLPFAPMQFSAERDLKWVRGKLIPSGGVRLAQIEENSVGVLAFSQSEDVAWIDQLYLQPEFVRQGIGSALLNHALDRLPRPVHLWAFQENDRAIAFYEHHGFKAIKRTDGSGNMEKCPDILFELA